MVQRKFKYPRLRDMPYYKTRVSADTTVGQIKALLKSYDIDDYQWTEMGGKEQLKFLFHATVQDTEKRIAVQMDIPIIRAITGQKYSVVEVPKAQLYRMFYWSLKGLLEATKYGIMRKEDVFFSYTLIQLPDGQSRTMKELAEKSRLSEFLLTAGE